MAQRGPAKARAAGASPASQTYYEWLKTQPAEFDIAIGTTRAKLLRSGGLSAERFAELQLGTNFQPLTPMKCDGWSRKHLPGSVSDWQSW